MSERFVKFHEIYKLWEFILSRPVFDSPIVNLSLLHITEMKFMQLVQIRYNALIKRPVIADDMAVVCIIE